MIMITGLTSVFGRFSSPVSRAAFGVQLKPNLICFASFEKYKACESVPKPDPKEL